nr:DNA-directed DNA polymerase [Tanacetum cinerariifolium]
MLAKGIYVNEEQVIIVGGSSDKPLKIIRVQIANVEARLTGEIKVEGRVKDGVPRFTKVGVLDVDVSLEENIILCRKAPHQPNIITIVSSILDEEENVNITSMSFGRIEQYNIMVIGVDEKPRKKALNKIDSQVKGYPGHAWNTTMLLLKHKSLVSVGNLIRFSNPSSNPNSSTNPKGCNRRRSKQRVENLNLDDLSPPVVTMAYQRTMAQLLQEPTEGYENSIVVPAIIDNFELKHGLLTLVQNKQLFGHDKKDPHAHVRYFNKITSTLKFPNVPNTSIKLMLFPFSLEGAARIWLEKEPHRSIFTWDDLVSKFINQFFPPSKTTNLQLHQLDTFYNALNSQDQDSLNSVAGGNFLEKIPRECLAIIESKSKVRYSRKKPVVAKVSTNTSTSGVSPNVAELKDMVKALLLDKKCQNQSPAPMKVVDESCVTYSGAHSYRNCPAIDGYNYHDNIQEFVSQASAVNFNQGNTSYRMAECLALADLDASINLIPFSVWKRLSLPDLTPASDFVVVYFDADPRVPLILGRSFLKTRRALIDVFEGELTLRFGKEAITFNLDQTLRYSANYSDMTAKRIDVIDMACEEYSQEVFGSSDTISSGNPTPHYDSIVSATFPTLTPEGHILLEAFLNDDPSLPLPNQRNYLPEVRKELKICEAKFEKSSVDEPLVVELKVLPPHLEYAFLEGDDKLPIIIAKDLSVEEKTALIIVLKSYKQDIAWKLFDIKGINPEFCTHKILMEEDFEPAVQHQRRVNPEIQDVIKQEVIELLDAGLIYPISDSPWVSPVHCVPKKGGFTVVKNKDNELIPTSLMLERLAGNQYCCFLDGFFGYFQIPIDPKDQEKTTFTCPYRMFAYRRMPFGLCNAPGTFQRCMMAIFHDMIEKTMEVFMDDFSVSGNSFQSCLSHLERMLKRCEDTNLCLNREKSHFMFKEGIVLGHKISKQRIEVDKAKVDIISKLPHPTTVKGIRSFLGHVGFYRRFIKDFSKIARPMTRLLEKKYPIHFLSRVLIAPDWDMPFELMCDASDFPIGAVLGQRQDKNFRPIHYASKTMTEAE